MFEPEIHEYRTTFSGDAAAALDLARTALVSQGFEITSDGGSELRLRGPGMHSNRQSALLGATDVWLRVTGSEIAVTATLGGVARMRAFVTLFPPGLIVFLFGLGWIAGQPALPWPWLLLMVAPWLFLSPWMAAAMKRNTENALDGMVRGMAQVGSAR